MISTMIGDYTIEPLSVNHLSQRWPIGWGCYKYFICICDKDITHGTGLINMPFSSHIQLIEPHIFQHTVILQGCKINNKEKTLFTSVYFTVYVSNRSSNTTSRWKYSTWCATRCYDRTRDRIFIIRSEKVMGLQHI